MSGHVVDVEDFPTAAVVALGVGLGFGEGSLANLTDHGEAPLDGSRA